jgi:hypothetical protein
MSKRAESLLLAMLGRMLPCVLLLDTTPICAQQLADPIAVELKRQGDVAIESGKFDDALKAYTKALSTEDSAALHYNRGRALQGLGRNSEAFTEFELFDSEASVELKAAVPEFDAMKRLVRSQIAEVNIECNIREASVHVAGKSLPLPLRAPLRFDPSTLNFEVVAPGYEPWHSRLTLTGGDERTLKPALTKRETLGTLQVASNIAGATVQIDGKPVGVVPVETRLSPGEHKVALSHASFKNAQSRIVMRAGEHRSLSVTLEPATRWYEAWWFWTATGAVVTASVVTGIALSTDKGPATGDIPPGRITAP